MTGNELHVAKKSHWAAQPPVILPFGDLGDKCAHSPYPFLSELRPSMLFFPSPPPLKHTSFSAYTSTYLKLSRPSVQLPFLTADVGRGWVVPGNERASPLTG